jgi:hypothetical protein
MFFKPTEVQNIQREKGMKIDPLLLPGKVSGISKNRCPESTGTSVRFAQESLSGISRNHCPDWPGITVRIGQEYALLGIDNL